MYLSRVFVLLALCAVVRGWIAFLQPIALTIGAALTALNLNIDSTQDLPTINLPYWLSASDKKKRKSNNKKDRWKNIDEKDIKKRKLKDEFQAKKPMTREEQRKKWQNIDDYWL